MRGVWLRHDLETRYKRLMRLERQSRDWTTFVLTDEQVRLLERHSADFRCRHVQSSAPGELLNQDTFYWGTLKGVGKVYVQVVIDTFCSLAFAKCYYERVLPFYDALGVPVTAVLTDNRREFCGKPDAHPYELLLAIEDIEHDLSVSHAFPLGIRTKQFALERDRSPSDGRTSASRCRYP